MPTLPLTGKACRGSREGLHTKAANKDSWPSRPVLGNSWEKNGRRQVSRTPGNRVLNYSPRKVCETPQQM